MRTVERKIDDLIPAEYNPRQMTEKQIEDLRASLKRFGVVEPILINTHKDRKNIIIGGHQRLRVWKGLGYDTIPCVEIKVNRDKERELNVRLNQNTGEWDIDALANNFDLDKLTDWGFDANDLGVFDVEETEPPDLADGDRSPFRLVTFTLHDEQWEEVEAALKKAKADGHGESAVNEKRNGNALAWIAQEFNRG